MEKTILTTGIFNLDTVVVRDYPLGIENRRDYVEREVVEEIGGTCGNVSAELAWLGNRVFPVARFDDSREGLLLSDDMRRYGCDTRFVTNTPEGGTTLLKCVHKVDGSGTHSLSCRSGSPGGSRFPRRRFIRMRDEAPAFLEGLDFVPDMFFFDDPAAGHRVLARALRQKGTTVYFEPSKMVDNADYQSVECSDIVKFSAQIIPDVSFADTFDSKIFIQTMGSEGLRYKLRSADWKTLPPVECGGTVDWEGAGDWTTSVFIHCLLDGSRLDVRTIGPEAIEKALMCAQRVAAQSVRYYSSKGLISEDPEFLAALRRNA